jgi:hypothetical protein
MHELLTDAEKEKMTAAGEEFYTEYFAEGENDGDFHAETGSPHRPASVLLSLLSFSSTTLIHRPFPIDQSQTKKTVTSPTRSNPRIAVQRIQMKSCASKRKWRKSVAGPRNLRARLCSLTAI